MPHLIGIEGLAAGTAFALTTPVVTIGHDAESDIALMDRAVLRHQARLLIDKSGQVHVEAGDSASTILVNDTRVARAVLAPGDLLQIGDSVFRFEA